MYVRGDSIALQAWLATAKDRGLVLVVPQMALAEVRLVYPGSAQHLALLLDFPWAVQLDLTLSDASGIARLLAETNAWDGHRRTCDPGGS